jgi:hypothetical protein
MSTINRNFFLAPYTTAGAQTIVTGRGLIGWFE